MVPETIDVTKYIESGEFLPDSCEDRLDRLIQKVSTPQLRTNYKLNLSVGFQLIIHG